jgi:hypothetical protein
MKIFILSIFLGISCFFLASEKERIQVGLYIEMVHGIDYVNGQYEVVFYLWINSKERVYNVQEEIDISNSLETEFSNEYIDSSINGDYHYECKVRATILNHFDIRNYPFDTQSIGLKLEFGNYSIDDLEIELDKNHSKIKPERTEGWNSKVNYFKTGFINYGSDFGDVNSDKSIDYPSIDIKLDLYRNSWNLYFKSFLTLFLSFILASVSMLYPNDHSEEKIGLIVGSLFTTVGNKYVTDDILPIQNVLNLSDKLHLLTIFIITLIATYAILEQRFKIKDSVRNDFLAFGFFSFLFFGGIVFFTLGAM